MDPPGKHATRTQSHKSTHGKPWKARGQGDKLEARETNWRPTWTTDNLEAGAKKGTPYRSLDIKVHTIAIHLRVMHVAF